MKPVSILIPITVVLILLGLVALPTGHAQPVVGSIGQYLPLVFKKFPPTETPIPSATLAPPTATIPPTPTAPTSTPAPAPAIRNGNFEEGRANWTTIEDDGPIIRSTDDLVAPPHTGLWAAWLGGSPSSTTAIVQQITIPKNQTYFTYWRWIASADICYEDIGGVSLLNDDGIVTDDEIVDAFELCDDNETLGWERVSIDVRRFAGQSRRLIILADTDSTLNSNLFIDDISLKSSSTTVITEAPAGGTEGADARRPGTGKRIASDALPVGLLERVRAHVQP